MDIFSDFDSSHSEISGVDDIYDNGELKHDATRADENFEGTDYRANTDEILSYDDPLRYVQDLQFEPFMIGAGFFAGTVAWKKSKSSEVEEKLRERINDLERENKSRVSDEDFNAQIEELRREMEKQNEAYRRAVEEEFELKKQQLERDAANYDERLSKLIQERDEIIARQKRESQQKFDELKRQYEQSVERHNQETAKMRQEQDELIAQLEKNRSNKMLRNEEITRQLHAAINDAQSELDIISPWLNEWLIKNNFLHEFRRAVQRGVKIKIRYGISGNLSGDAERNKKSDEAAKMLRRELGNINIVRGNEHSKLFICDENYYVITSFNPLSFEGNYLRPNQRGEIGELSHDKENLSQYRATYFNF